MTRIPALLLMAIVAQLTACASPRPAAQHGLGTLQLRENLVIAPDSATARLQYGHIVASNAVQEQDPFCVFEIDSVRPYSQNVAPGQFRIVAVSRSVSSIAEMRVDPFNTWSARRIRLGDDDMPSHIYYKTTFHLLNSEQQQPQVRALTCMSNQNMPGTAVFMRHLTPAEIRAALGNWFTLNLELRA